MARPLEVRPPYRRGVTAERVRPRRIPGDSDQNCRIGLRSPAHLICHDTSVPPCHDTATQPNGARLMAIYPKAVQRLIPHNPVQDPRITPRVAILHVDAGG